MANVAIPLSMVPASRAESDEHQCSFLVSRNAETAVAPALDSCLHHVHLDLPLPLSYIDLLARSLVLVSCNPVTEKQDSKISKSTPLQYLTYCKRQARQREQRHKLHAVNVHYTILVR